MYKIQKIKDKVWHDETGMTIPVSRITKAERLAEKKAGQLIKEALKINKQLAYFKELIRQASEEVFEAFMQENKIPKKDAYKGNYTWYNFDRSIKIEVNMHEPIEFDDLTIQAAQEKLMSFIDKNVNSEDQFIKDLVRDAFKTRRGKLDTKKILNLTRYVDKVKDPLFKEAVDLINKAVRRKPKRAYYRVFVRNDQGGYDLVDLNLSSI